MYHPTIGRRALGLGLVVILAVLALSACGEGGSSQDQAKAPPLTRESSIPALWPIPLGRVRALALLRGRQGLVDHRTAVARLYAVVRRGGQNPPHHPGGREG